MRPPHQVLRGGSKLAYMDPQKLPGVVPGDPRLPIPVLSSPNHTREHQPAKPKSKEDRGFFARVLPRPLVRALDTVFGGRRRGQLSDKSGLGSNGLLGKVWNEHMSSGMLGRRLKKVFSNYQVRTTTKTGQMRTLMAEE